MRRLALLLLPLLAAPARAETILKLAETATVMVSPDQLVAALRATAVTPTAAAAQAKVNAQIADALARAKRLPAIEASTGGYGVWRSFDQPNVKAEKWQASQTVLLKGRDGAVLLELVGELQAAGLAVSQLDWQLSPEAARHAREQATAQAIAALRGRAEAAAKLLDLSFGEFREVRLDSVRPMPPMPRAMMAATALPASPSPPPSAVATDVEVSATAEADVALRAR